jgi:putative solute:sodium symporter small subunit
LLLIWLYVSFIPSFFARDLAMEVNGWPLYFWMAAQGSVLVFAAIVVIYAWHMNHWEVEEVVALPMTTQDLPDAGSNGAH